MVDTSSAFQGEGAQAGVPRDGGGMFDWRIASPGVNSRQW